MATDVEAYAIVIGALAIVVSCLVYCAVNWDDPPQCWPDCFKNEWQKETRGERI